MEQRLVVFDIAEVRLRIVCQKKDCGAVVSVAPTMLSVEACPNCGTPWSIARGLGPVAELAKALEALQTPNDKYKLQIEAKASEGAKKKEA